MYRSEAEILVDFVKRLHPKKTLEIGCNTGRELDFIKDLTKTYGVDKDEEKVKGKRNLKCAEGSKVPWQNNFFDLVYTCGCLSHNSDPEPILEEMLRVSRKWVLLIEWIGTKTGTTYTNVKEGVSWIHDYEMLIVGRDVDVIFDRKIPVGADLFHVMLLRKEKRKIVEVKEKIKELLPVFCLRVGKYVLRVEESAKE